MVTTVGIGHSYDGPKWTVNQMLKKPTFVPNLVKRLVEDSNLSDWLLRPGPTAVGGSVVYEETVALYAENGAEVVAEFGEIPGTWSPARVPVTRATTKHGVHLKISEEMKDRNDVGRVRDEIEMVRRTLVATRDQSFINIVLNHPNVIPGTVLNTTGGWLSGTTSVVADVAEAVFQISSQQPQGTQFEERMGYEADIMIIHPSIEAGLIDNEEVNRIFAGSPMADQQLRFTGKLPRKFLNLNVMKSWRCPIDKVIIAQRNYMGFISKEKPLSASPMREDPDTQSWRTNFSYRELVAVDNPKAVYVLTGVSGA